VSSLFVFSIGFPVFLWNESVAPLPIMPLGMIRKAPYANLIISNFLSSMVTNSIIFNVPLYFQAVLLKNATNSGLQLALPSVCTMVAALVTGSLITRWQRIKWPVFVGSFLILIGAACLSAMHAKMPSWQYIIILAPTSLGVGFM
jgi:MFS family permease